MERTYIKRVSRVVTAQAGSCCRCKFPLEDKYGKYQGYESHDNWDLWHQDHTDSNFEYFLTCLGCGYELAKKYWKDLDGTFVDYTDGVADGFWKCPTVDSRKFPSKESAQADFEHQRDTTEWTRPTTIEDDELRQCDSCGRKKDENEYNGDDPECKKCRNISNSEEGYFNDLAYGSD